MSDWIKHDGGKRPVEPTTRVVVKHRSGETSDSYVGSNKSDEAKEWAWHHNGDPGDIIAYRLAPAQQSSQ